MVHEPKNLNGTSFFGLLWYSQAYVTVYRQGVWAMLKSDQLLPGDVVSIGRWGEESTVCAR